MAVFETWLKSDLKKPLTVKPLAGNLFSADNQGNLIGVEVMDGGSPAALSGGVTGYVIRADGATLPISGTLAGNRASIVLPASAYTVIGHVSIVIKVGSTTVGACTSYVYQTTTDTIVDPGRVIPSIAELLAQIEACRTATTNANTAASSANTAATNANTKAGQAETAAGNANTAAGKIDNMTVTATTLSAGSQATVSVTEVDGHKHIEFGVPKGESGNETIDDTAGAGDTDKVWSADKSTKEVTDLKDALNTTDAETKSLINNALIYELGNAETLTGIAGIVSKTGAINTGASGFIHYFIDALSGDVFKIKSQEQSSADYPFVLFYNDDAIIGYYQERTGQVITRNIFVPSGANKICVNGYGTSTVVNKLTIIDSNTVRKNTLNNSLKIDGLGETLSNYVLLYGVSEHKTLTGQTGLYGFDGALNSANTHYDITVKPFDKCIVSAYGFPNFPYVVFFDADNNLVSYVESGVTTAADITKQIEVPLRAVKMGINHYATPYHIASCYVQSYSNIGSAIKEINGNLFNVGIYDTLPDAPMPLNSAPGYYKTDGTIATFSDTNIVHYTVPVKSKKYEYGSYGSQNALYPTVVFLRADGTVISTVPEHRWYETGIITVPDGAVTIGLNHYITDNASYAFKLYEYQLTNTQEYIEGQKSNWQGKKIVWFGTSIPAGVVNAGGTGGNGSYPARIGEMLGATVYNEAVGSSCVRGGSHAHITADDPMGWGDMHVLSVMYSLSLSSAEKQSIIDNWDSKWKSIIQNADMFDPSMAETYKASSWDNKLTKYLSGGSIGQCDLYVIDHGYNDYVKTIGFTDLEDEPETANDRTYFYGALDFIVRKILDDNPKAHILLIGHYSRGAYQFSGGANFDMKYICDAQMKYADKWCITCIPTWNLLGLSSNTITVNGETKSVIAARYPDKLHPASDLTGMELKRYAEALAPYVNMAVGS